MDSGPFVVLSAMAEGGDTHVDRAQSPDHPSLTSLKEHGRVEPEVLRRSFRAATPGGAVTARRAEAADPGAAPADTGSEGPAGFRAAAGLVPVDSTVRAAARVVGVPVMEMLAMTPPFDNGDRRARPRPGPAASQGGRLRTPLSRVRCLNPQTPSRTVRRGFVGSLCAAPVAGRPALAVGSRTGRCRVSRRRCRGRAWRRSRRRFG